MAKQDGTQTWHANYWKDEKHGKAWDRVSDALKRDWEQTRNDFSSGGRDLNQNVGDTVKQAAGKEPIPSINRPNPARPDERYEDVSPAMQYGFGARQQYGTQYKAWDDTLEQKLAEEWDDQKAGRRFDEVKPWVRRGWEKTI